MSNSLKNRIKYWGGNSNGRIKQTKLWSFHLALASDYNSRWIKTPLKRIVRCLINTDNIKMDYDKKIISVDFSSELEPGDVFQCLDDQTYWMILLPDLVETAYLKAQIIRCRYQLDINNKNYWIYFQGPTETDIRWFQKRSINLNEMNLSGRIYIKKDENTLDYFHRFTKINIAGLPWEVQTIDSISTPGVIELVIKEDYTNEYKNLPSVPIEDENDIIIGQDIVKQDSNNSYMINSNYYDESGQWILADNDSKAILTDTYQNARICSINILESAIGSFKIKYITNDTVYEKEITIADPVQYIQGPDEVYPYDIVTYTSLIEGEFTIPDERMAKIIESSRTQCTVEIISRKKSSFTLGLITDDNEQYIKTINIKSL